MLLGAERIGQPRSRTKEGARFGPAAQNAEVGVSVQAPQKDAGQGMDTRCRPSCILEPGLLSNAM